MRTAVRILSLLACFALACDDDPVADRPADSQPDVVAEDREADEAALWLSRELTSPPELYQTIHNDLVVIRGAYAGSVPKVSVKFRPLWVPSMIILSVDDDLKQQLLAGQPTSLDYLNGVMQAIEVDTSKLEMPGLGFLVISFAGRKHSQRLAELYRTVPGVTAADPNGWYGDGPQLYPWRSPEGGMSYLFRDAFGDCPAGCIYSIFYYFRRVNGQTEYVGSYDRRVDAEPSWWAEAKIAYTTHRQGLEPPPAD